MRTASPLLRGWLSPNRYGLKFDGSSQSVTSSNIGLSAAQALSVECVLRLDSTLGAAAGISVVTQGGASGRWWLYVDSSNGRLGVNSYFGPGHDYYLNGGVDMRGRTAHFAATWNRLGMQTLYVGGVQQAQVDISGASAVPWDTSSIMNIAGMLNEQLRGLIAGVRVYKRVLSAAEVAQHAAGIFQDERGLYRWYPGVEGSGTVLYDASGNGINGTLTGAPAWEFFDLYPDSMRRLIVADLYTFELVTGTVLRYAQLDVDVSYGGNLYSASAPIISRSRVRSTVGISVDAMDLTINPRSGDTIAGVPWVAAARAGALDGARITVQRAYVWNPYVPPIGVLTIFAGRASVLTGGRSEVRLQVKSDLELLNMKLPRNLVQPGCLHTLFDVGCTLSKETYRTETRVTSATPSQITTAATGQSSGYFDLGTVTITAGYDAVDDEPVALEYDFVGDPGILPVRAYGPAALTVTRSGNTATRVNESGHIEVVNANLPRFDYDPVTLECLGLLTEEQRTNLCLQSNAFATSPWTGGASPVQNAVGPDGISNSAWTLTDDDTGNYESDGQSWTVANDSLSHVYALYVKKTTDATNTFGCNFNLTGGTTVAANPRLNTNSGVCTGGAYAVDCGAYWRFCCKVTNNSSGNTTLTLNIYPATGTNSGSNPGSDDAAATGSAVISRCDVVKAERETSHIPTTTTSVTRNGDVVTDNAAASWVTSTEGTLMIEARSGWADAAYHWVAQIDPNGSTSGRMTLTRVPTSGALELSMVDDGGVFVFAVGPSCADNAVFRVAYAYKTNDFQTAFNGTLQTPDTSGVPCTMTRLTVGHQAGANQLNGHIRRLIYLRKRLTNAALDAWTEYQEIVNSSLYGVTRTVKQHVSNDLKLALPLPSALSANDTLRVYPGCDKRQSTCTSKFNNLVNFRGLPYVPVPETAT